MLEQRYWSAQTLEEHVSEADKNRDLWHALIRRAHVAPEVVERVRRLDGDWHLLVLSEHWCGDGVNTLPWLDRLAAEAGNLDLRVLPRDQNPDLMDAHLTHGSRSIPVVMVLDARFREVGWWGPRPRELQRWVRSEGMQLDSRERYREIRGWYARDQGRSTLDEVVRIMEEAASRGEQAVA